jgi:hypothetical protein
MQVDHLPLEAVANDFLRTFTQQDYFKTGCAICILISDQLLTRSQVQTHAYRFLFISISSTSSQGHFQNITLAYLFEALLPVLLKTYIFCSLFM